MAVWIVLIRGINVGGRVLPMKRLVERMESAGCSDVKTYIQSGNAVCRAAGTAKSIATKIGTAILATEGYEPRVMVLSLADFQAAIAANPYPTTVPKLVHLFFLDQPPASLAALDAVKLASEQYTLSGTTFYFHAPDGFGTSKLAGQFEKLAKVAATARNWNTIIALRDLAATFGAKASPAKAAPAKASPSPGTGRSSPSTRAKQPPTRGPRKTPR